jgi:hypothetical protein
MGTLLNGFDIKMMVKRDAIDPGGWYLIQPKSTKKELV